MALTPSQRRTRARIAALARPGGPERTQAATAAANHRFLVEAVEDFKRRGESWGDQANLEKRADQLRRQHMTRLALKSSKARSKA